MRLPALLFGLFGLIAPLGAQDPVRVVAYDKAGHELRTGRAVVLDRQGYFVTTRSLLTGAARLEVLGEDGSRQPVPWVAADDAGGSLVKLWTERPSALAPTFHPEAAASQPVLEFDGKIAKVRKVRDVPGSGIIVELDATADYPMAGAPILDDEKHVAGLVVPQFLGTRNVAFCVPVSRRFETNSQFLLTVEEWSAKHGRAAEEAFQAALGQIWGEYYDAAVRNLEEAVTAKPDFAEAWFYLGLAHAKLGHAAPKIHAYQKAISLKQDFAEAHFSLGISFVLQGDRKEALEEVAALQKIGSTDLAERLTKLVESIHVDSIKKSDKDHI